MTVSEQIKTSIESHRGDSKLLPTRTVYVINVLRSVPLSADGGGGPRLGWLYRREGVVCSGPYLMAAALCVCVCVRERETDFVTSGEWPVLLQRAFQELWTLSAITGRSHQLISCHPRESSSC